MSSVGLAVNSTSSSETFPVPALGAPTTAVSGRLRMTKAYLVSVLSAYFIDICLKMHRKT